MQLDARDLPYYPRKYGSNPNMIWVRSNWMGQVFGYFRLYNILGWRFRWCEIGSVPNTSLCLISNPFIPSVWDVRTDDQSILPHTWVSEASTDNMVHDLPPKAPSFITRVCRSGFHSLGFRFGQARRARSPQIAQAPGALLRVFCYRATSAA